MGLGRIDKLIHSHGLAWNHTKWLELNSGPFGVGTATGELGLTLTHHTPGLRVSHHLTPNSILYDSSRGWHPNGLFVPGVPKSRNFGLLRLWSLITFGANLRSSCLLKQSCRSHRDLSKGMSHVLWSQVFRVDSRLLLVGTQNWRTPGSSTPGPSFGHNLCFRCPNEQCEPIFDIYTSRAFHLHKERNETLRFDPSNLSLKFWESLWDSNSHQLPTWEFTWECEGSFPHTLRTLCTPGSMWCDSWVYF
jgi:hypothetical protein